jgi:hypothetical protein
MMKARVLPFFLRDVSTGSLTISFGFGMTVFLNALLIC